MYKIGNMPKSLELGYIGENLFRTIEIDMSAWVEKLPGGVPSIIHIQPGKTEADAYIADTSFDTETNVLSWTITDADLGLMDSDNNGEGEIQVWMEEETDDDSVTRRGKSIHIASIIHKSATEPDDEPPAAQTGWMEAMTALKTATVSAAEDAEDAKDDAVAAKEAAEDAQEDAETAQAAAETAQAAAETAMTKYPKVESDGYWYVWNPSTGEYQNTNVKAQGPQGETGDPTLLIDDTTPASNKTFSSSKVNTELGGVLNAIAGQEADITSLKYGGGLLTTDVKNALLNIFGHLVYTDSSAQTYISALTTAWGAQATLTSITAVFTQGSAVIEEGDSLDTLEQYLTVTGLYTVGEQTFTEEITDYTLSGTLTVGTSTITVTVGELTTTFTVIVSAYNDYVIYSKLIATGDQYIDPNLTEEDMAGCHYEYKCRPNSERSGSGHIFSSQYTFVGFPQVNNNRWLAKIKGGSDAASSNNLWSNNTDYTVEAFADGNNSVKVNGEKVINAVTAGSSGSSSNKFAIIGYGGNMSTGYYRFRGALYYLKIYNSSNVLIHHFVPAKKKSTNKYGLYDEVTENFFSSATSTEFTVE